MVMAQITNVLSVRRGHGSTRMNPANESSDKTYQTPESHGSRAHRAPAFVSLSALSSQQYFPPTGMLELL